MSIQSDSVLAGQRPASGRHVATVLLIEDDNELAALMSAYLARHGFGVDVARDGRQGLSQAVISSVDLVILDVMLPHLSGFDVLRYLRRRSRVPVIMVTARGAHDDRVAGLRLGADDYLSKPFEPEELLARVEAILRRTRGDLARQHELLQGLGISLNVTTREVRRHGKSIDLTAAETDILEILMRSEGRAVSRDEMSAVLHQRETTRCERSLDVHISRLRHKLGASQESLIRAVRSVGYMLSAQ